MSRWFTATVKYYVPVEFVIAAHGTCHVIEVRRHEWRTETFMSRNREHVERLARAFVKKLHKWYDVELYRVAWFLDVHSGDQWLWGYSHSQYASSQFNVPDTFWSWLYRMGYWYDRYQCRRVA